MKVPHYGEEAEAAADTSDARSFALRPLPAGTWGVRGQAGPDGVEGDPLVRGVRATRFVELRQVEAARVMQTDQLPMVVENRAAGASPLGGGSIMHDALVVVEQEVVLQGELGLGQSARMADS